MEKPPVLTLEKAPAASKPIFEGIQKAFGVLPNLYTVIGNSARALQANLDFGKKLEEGHFDFKHGEVIKLAASEANACHYCIAAHSAILGNFKFSATDSEKIRFGGHPDAKIDAIATLTREIVTTRGYPSAPALKNFYAQGYDHGALVELIAYIALNTMNNYVNHLSETPIDWPAVQQLPTPLNER
jgi:AhpD family alkylhydroperoxidase